MNLFPGWRLHPLTGDLKGFWSVSVSGNWRPIFRFENGDARDLDLVDYHCGMHAMKNPCHPGEIIREELLKPLGLTVTDAAKVLHVARPTLSN